MTTSENIVSRFLDYLRYERNYSVRTIESYGEDLQQFEAFFRGLDEGLTWQTADSDVVRDWVEYLMDRGNSATTVNRRLCALRSFYRYAMKHGLADRDPAHIVKGPKKAKPLPKFLKEDEMNSLIDDYPWEDTYRDHRDRTVILLFYSTGMRVSELIQLNDSDIDFMGKELHVVGKGNKQRHIPFADELLTTLKAYIARRNRDVERRCEALIVDEKGNRMTYNKMVHMVKKRLGHVTTQQRRSPHVLRHTFATAMMNHDAGIETVKSLLGHESVRTTSIYTHTTFEQLKKAYHNAHPREKGEK